MIIESCLSNPTSAKTRNTLSAMGVPQSLLINFRENLSSKIKTLDMGENRIITASVQKDLLEEMLTNPMRNITVVMQSNRDAQIARKVALAVFKTNVSHYLSNMVEFGMNRPIWYYAGSNVQIPDGSLLLVIDGLSDQIGGYKKERIMDVINTTMGRPKLLLFYGESGVKFCKRTFGLKVNGVVSFDDGREVVL